MKRPLLTMAAALACAVVVLALVRTNNVPALATLVRIDNTIHDWAVTHQSPALTTFMTAITHLGGGSVVVVVLAAFALYAAKSRRWGQLVALIVSVAGGATISDAVKEWIARERPPVETHLVIADNPAFPSGHAIQAIVCYIAVAVMLRRRRWWFIMVGLAVSIGVSRVYLGVHWPTDVVGGWLLGGCWLVMVLSGLSWWNRRRDDWVTAQPCPANSSGGTASPLSSSAAS